MKATSSSHWDIMAYVDRDRTPGMSTTKKAPPVISIVRMASVSINVLQSTPSVSYFFQDLLLIGLYSNVILLPPSKLHSWVAELQRRKSS